MGIVDQVINKCKLWKQFYISCHICFFAFIYDTHLFCILMWLHLLWMQIYSWNFIKSFFLAQFISEYLADISDILVSNSCNNLSLYRNKNKDCIRNVFYNSFTTRLLLVCSKTMTKAENHDKNKKMLIQLEVVSKIEGLYGIILSNLQRQLN